MKRGSTNAQVWSVLIPLLAAAAAIQINVGGFWWGSRPGWWNTAVTAAWLLFWAACTLRRRGRTWRRMVLAFGAGTLLSGLTGLGAAVWRVDWLTPPALLLALVFATPLYGLTGLLRGNQVQWSAVLVLGAAWSAAGVWLGRRRT